MYTGDAVLASTNTNAAILQSNIARSSSRLRMHDTALYGKAFSPEQVMPKVGLTAVSA